MAKKNLKRVVRGKIVSYSPSFLDKIRLNCFVFPTPASHK